MDDWKVCPNCGARIVYDYNENNNSYYLRCERNYTCWNHSSNAEKVKKYPKYRSKMDAMAEKMREAVLDDEQDYFYWDE